MSEIMKCERCKEYNAAAVDFRHQATSAQNDYAALLARHTALVEAVAKMRHANNKNRWDALEWAEACAEVDRLIVSEGAANCKGEG